MADNNAPRGDRASSDAVDELEDLSAEPAGDPGSDDSPRGNPGDSAMGGSLNSGPNDAGFAGSEEIASRAQASGEPGHDADSGAPREHAETTAPGDNLNGSVPTPAP